MAKLGNRATLKSIPRQFVDVPVQTQVNGSDPQETPFRIREMNGTERDLFEASVLKEERYKDEKGEEQTRRVVDMVGLRAKLLAKCLVDEEGNRLYTDDEVGALADEVPASVIETLFLKAQKLNKLEAVAVEQAAKNSASAPAGASSSGLH